MKSNLVSIIIPSYNSVPYIKEAVDSALDQTYSPVEVVVVDDGSTDNTKEALATYLAKNKIKYVFQPNKGLAGARNTGIRNSEGEFIALLDADDVFLPNKLAKQVAYLKAHPDCDVSYCDIYHFYDEDPGKLLKLNYEYRSGRNVFPELLKKNFINPLSVVMRRTVVDHFGIFDEKMRRSEDWDYWVRLAWQGANFCFLPEILAKYRIRRDTSLSYSAASEVERKATTLAFFERLNWQMPPAERRRYRMGAVLLRHRMKLFYAQLENGLSPLKKLHRWLQARRLRQTS